MPANCLSQSEVNDFLGYCHKICKQRSYAFYLEEDSVWNEEKERKFQFGIIAGLFFEEDSLLLELLKKSCDHNELKCLLEYYRNEQIKSEYVCLAKEYNVEYQYPEVKEPLIEWIYTVNYLLAYPLSGDITNKDERIFVENPEKILTYVYLNLKLEEYERKHRPSLFKQKNIKRIYSGLFDKTSSFKTYGLIPIDTKRILHSFDNPVRIYDYEIDKTVFLQIPRSLAIVLQKLIEEKYIKTIAFRGDDYFIYEGENHYSLLFEAIEAGKIFDLDVASLPNMSKLISDNIFDSLWITVDEANITFEELYDNIFVKDNSVVTQVVHLQYEGKNITHIDHEFIFYSIEEYEERQLARRKGETMKRFKTFKVDDSSIPFDYDCSMILLKDNERNEIKIPFIYFVLNTYFMHKELLEEYFQKILTLE